MGSYASQTSIEERWLIDHYVMKLKSDLQGNPERAFDSEITEMENLVPAVNAEGDMVPGDDTSKTGEQENQNEE